MDPVTRVPWSHKSHLLHLLRTQEVVETKSMYDFLFFSVKEIRLPSCAPKAKKKFFFFQKHPKWSSKTKHDLLLMSNLQSQVTPTKLCTPEQHSNNKLEVNVF